MPMDDSFCKNVYLFKTFTSGIVVLFSRESIAGWAIFIISSTIIIAILICFFGMREGQEFGLCNQKASVFPELVLHI